MSDAQNPQTPPPPQPVFLVSVGKVHGQTWFLLWLAVTYLVGALLPWDGAGDISYLLSEPFKGEQVISAAEHTAYTHLHNYNPSLVEKPGQIVQVIDNRGMGFGRVLVLLCAIAMTVMGAVNIWTKRLSMTATLMTWFVALAAIHWASGWDVGSAAAPVNEPSVVKGFSQIGAMFGAIGNSFGTLFGSGLAKPEDAAALSRFGMGWYVTLIAELGLIIFIVMSIVTGGKKKGDAAPAGAKGAPAKGAPARRPAAVKPTAPGAKDGPSA